MVERARVLVFATKVTLDDLVRFSQFRQLPERAEVYFV